MSRKEFDEEAFEEAFRDRKGEPMSDHRLEMIRDVADYEDDNGYLLHEYARDIIIELLREIGRLKK